MGKKIKVGFLTIGQSPREDVLDDITPLLGPRVEVIEAGALDGLSPQEIKALAPGPDDFPLITRLRDKTSTVVGRRKILSLLQAKGGELEKKGSELLALLCTEHFPELCFRRTLLLPARVMAEEVARLNKTERLLVCVPLEEQKEAARWKWQKAGLEVVTEVLNPYGDLKEKENLLKKIERENVDLILFDCIGYPISLEKEMAARVGKPVLLPRSALVRKIMECLNQE